MESLRELVEQGKRQLEGKNYGRAEQCFLKLLKKGARYADVFNMLGSIYHAEGKFNDAIECFRNALKINPNYTEAVLNLTILLNDLGDYKESKALYGKIRQKKKEACEINPVMRGKIANMHMAIAETYSGIGRTEEAIEEYKKALELCPTYKDIRTKLGISYRENNQTDMALKELSATVRDNPNFHPARIQLGLTYYAKGDKKRAAKEWNEVLKRDKDNPTVKVYLRL